MSQVKLVRASSLPNGEKAWQAFRATGSIVGAVCVGRWEILAAETTRQGTRTLVIRPRSLMGKLSMGARGDGCWISRPSRQLLNNLDWEQIGPPQDWREEPKRFEI